MVALFVISQLSYESYKSEAAEELHGGLSGKRASTDKRMRKNEKNLEVIRTEAGYEIIRAPRKHRRERRLW